MVMFADPRSRRLGDMAAGTLVIHDAGTVTIETIQPLKPQGLGAGISEETALGGFPVHQLTRADLQFVEEYLQRRKSLDMAIRHQLTPQVIRRLYQSVGWQDHPLPDMPETFLNALMNAFYPEKEERRPE
jgi:hypothetical protein